MSFRLQRLRDEMELLGFTVSGHPLDQFAGIPGDTYCTIASLDKFPNQRVTVCGLIIVDRSHHQITGGQMKFITICDHTGIIECELFADTYRRFGIQTVRSPVAEIEATVTPSENARGCTLHVHWVGKPRKTVPHRIGVIVASANWTEIAFHRAAPETRRPSNGVGGE